MALETYTHRIGDAEITQVVEMEIGPLLKDLLPDATPDRVGDIEWMGPFRNDDNSLRAISQSFFVRLGDRLLVLDTCVGNEKTIEDFPVWNDMNLPFLETLEEAGIDRFAVTDVLCSHLHLDHVGWNTYKKDGEWAPTFPNARYHFARGEYDFWHDTPADSSFDELQKVVLTESVYPVVEAGLVNFVEVDADLGDGISLIPTPGHTHSHVSVRIETGGEVFVLGGDMSHHPVQIANPDWRMVLDYDGDQSAATRNDLFEELADTPVIFTCTHFSLPSFGYISKDERGQFVFTLKDAAS